VSCSQPDHRKLTRLTSSDIVSASSTSFAASIGLIKQALTSFVEIVDVLPASQKEDQLAVATYLFAELLRDETAKADLAGPCLPLLKAICDRAYAARQPGSHIYARVLHGLLSACIQHVDEMRYVVPSAPLPRQSQSASRLIRP